MTAISSEHTDLGAYALGLLEDRDKAAFEAHLATCDACSAELSSLAPVATLLKGMEPVVVPGDAALPVAVDLLHRRAAASRRRRRRQVLVSAAACVGLLVGGIGVGLAVAPSHVQVVQPGLTGQRHTATNAANGVTGTVGLVTKGWGTQVWLDLAGLRGPQECVLIAFSKTGASRVVTGWFVPAPGDGVPGHPAHLLVEGGTAISLPDLARFEVIRVDGPTLLTIPV
jgi:Putative zinc-finger